MGIITRILDFCRRIWQGSPEEICARRERSIKDLTRRIKRLSAQRNALVYALRERQWGDSWERLSLQRRERELMLRIKYLEIEKELLEEEQKDEQGRRAKGL